MASETKIYNENLYRVQFTANGEFMKVFMPEPNMHTNVTNEDPPAAPTEKTDKKSNQTVSARYGDQQSPLIDETKIPETVLQFQRQLRKTQAAKRASAPLSKDQLRVIHNDEHIVVVNKPSGVLTVPGLNSNPSMLTLLHEEYRHEMVDAKMKREHMIIHRLDMDTSGIVVFAKTKAAMAALHSSFRERHVSKFYEAVVCGHIDSNVKEGSIDLPLQRDHRCPPFMRVATPESERAAKEVVKDLNHAGWKKIVKKNAKPSQTLFEIIDREYVILSLNAAGGEDKKKQQMQQRLPVTRIKLTPITGRTHQLRAHCAAIGHPILGDPTYGVYGEASPNGGFENDDVDLLIPSRASMDLQLSLNQYVKENEQVMCLHARELRITHPHSGDAMVFQDPPAF
jgi:23S rRNA-/tRNA-specific pseudouridylate synthase